MASTAAAVAMATGGQSTADHNSDDFAVRIAVGCQASHGVRDAERVEVRGAAGEVALNRNHMRHWEKAKALTVTRGKCQISDLGNCRQILNPTPYF
jgi:hypothetical protein